MTSINKTFNQQAAIDIISLPPSHMRRIREGAFRFKDIPKYIQMCVSLKQYRRFLATSDKPQFIKDLST